jgi:hypothetical protein
MLPRRQNQARTASRPLPRQTVGRPPPRPRASRGSPGCRAVSARGPCPSSPVPASAMPAAGAVLGAGAVRVLDWQALLDALAASRTWSPQVVAMDRFCLGRGLAVSRWVREIGGGMNLPRPKFTALVDNVQDGRGIPAGGGARGQAGPVRVRLPGACRIPREMRDRGGEPEIAVPAAGTGRRLAGGRAHVSCCLYGLRKYRKTLQQALATDVTQ